VVPGVLALAAIVSIGALASGLLERAPAAAPRHAPAIPDHLAQTFIEFPVDNAGISSRPVRVIAQSFGDGTGSAVIEVAAATLPPGVTPQLLAQSADAGTSALYRTPEVDPSVHVHVLHARDADPARARAISSAVEGAAGPDAAVNDLQVEVQRARGGQYRGRHVRTLDADVYVLQKTDASLIVIVFSPAASGRELAARLVTRIASGEGLYDERDIREMLYALPSKPPAGFEIDRVLAFNVNKMPDQLEASLRQVFGENAPRVGQQIQRVMPERFVTSVYRGPAQLEVLVNDYASGAAGWTAWTMLRWRLRHVPGTGADLSADGLAISADAARYLLLRRGRYLAAVQGEESASESSMRDLAGSLQLD
jgi:hypothetical protein